MHDALYFSDHHLQVREMVRDFARTVVKPTARQYDLESRFPWDNVRQMADLGLFGIPWSEELGGSGMDYLSYIIVIHELAKVDASHGLTVSAHTNLGTSPIVQFGTVLEDLKGSVSSPGEVLTQWEEIKAVERRERRERSMFASVPDALPALLKALRISSKAARVGFDWVDRDGLLEKVDEELRELREALKNDDRAAIAEELGDLLFTLANVARHVDLDPEAALQAANRKFIGRFRKVEEGLRRRGLKPSEENRPAMERLWIRAKRTIKRTSPARTSPSGGTSGNAPRAARRRTSS